MEHPWHYKATPDHPLVIDRQTIPESRTWHKVATSRTPVHAVVKRTPSESPREAVHDDVRKRPAESLKSALNVNVETDSDVHNETWFAEASPRSPLRVAGDSQFFAQVASSAKPFPLGKSGLKVRRKKSDVRPLSHPSPLIAANAESRSAQEFARDSIPPNVPNRLSVFDRSSRGIWKGRDQGGSENQRHSMGVFYEPPLSLASVLDLSEAPSLPSPGYAVQARTSFSSNIAPPPLPDGPQSSITLALADSAQVSSQSTVPADNKSPNHDSSSIEVSEYSPIRHSQRKIGDQNVLDDARCIIGTISIVQPQDLSDSERHVIVEHTKAIPLIKLYPLAEAKRHDLVVKHHCGQSLKVEKENAVLCIMPTSEAQPISQDLKLDLKMCEQQELGVKQITNTIFPLALAKTTYLDLSQVQSIQHEEISEAISTQVILPVKEAVFSDMQTALCKSVDTRKTSEEIVVSTVLPIHIASTEEYSGFFDHSIGETWNTADATETKLILPTSSAKIVHKQRSQSFLPKECTISNSQAPLDAKMVAAVVQGTYRISYSDPPLVAVGEVLHVPQVSRSSLLLPVTFARCVDQVCKMNVLKDVEVDHSGTPIPLRSITSAPVEKNAVTDQPPLRPVDNFPSAGNSDGPEKPNATEPLVSAQTNWPTTIATVIQITVPNPSATAQLATLVPQTLPIKVQLLVPTVIARLTTIMPYAPSLLTHRRSQSSFRRSVPSNLSFDRTRSCSMEASQSVSGIFPNPALLGNLQPAQNYHIHPTLATEYDKGQASRRTLLQRYSADRLSNANGNPYPLRQTLSRSILAGAAGSTRTMLRSATRRISSAPEQLKHMMQQEKTSISLTLNSAESSSFSRLLDPTIVSLRESNAVDTQSPTSSAETTQTSDRASSTSDSGPEESPHAQIESEAHDSHFSCTPTTTSFNSPNLVSDPSPPDSASNKPTPKPSTTFRRRLYSISSIIPIQTSNSNDLNSRSPTPQSQPRNLRKKKWWNSICTKPRWFCCFWTPGRSSST